MLYPHLQDYDYSLLLSRDVECYLKWDINIQKKYIANATLIK